jgi:hypothetical protein
LFPGWRFRRGRVHDRVTDRGNHTPILRSRLTPWLEERGRPLRRIRLFPEFNSIEPD